MDIFFGHDLSIPRRIDFPVNVRIHPCAEHAKLQTKMLNHRAGKTLIGTAVMLLFTAGCEKVAEPASSPAPIVTPAAALDLALAKLSASGDAASANAFEDQVTIGWLKSGSPTADLLMRRAMAAEADGDLEAAAGFLDRAISVSPDWAAGLSRRAVVAWAMDDTDTTLRNLERALAKEPRHYPSYVGLGIVFEKLGRKEAARAAFLEALSIHPFHEPALSGAERMRIAIEGVDT
jgi:tetratricopeptide (TPR) repeat protein